MTEISFFPTVCLRSPRYPIDHYDFSENLLQQAVNDELFLDSIYVASPDLYKILEKWKRGEIKDEKKRKKISLTLLKYYNRMCFRATPFGLFSSYGTVKWGSTTSITINPDKISGKLKLDTGFLCVLIENLEKSFLPQLSYQTNTSLYRVGNEYRYYEYEIDQTQKKYKLSAIEISEELDLAIRICLNTLTPFSALCDKLCSSFQLSRPAVSAYLTELINSQVLVSSLQPRLSDNDPLLQAVTVLEGIKTDNNNEIDYQVNILKELAARLQSATGGAGLRFQLADILQSITSAAIAPAADNLSLFQLDSYNSSANCTINTDTQYTLIKGIRALQILAAENTQNKWYSDIKEKINKRFGNKPVLLTHLFDPDTGIIDPGITASIDFGDELLNQLNIFKSHQGKSLAENDKASPARDFLTQKLNDLLYTDSFIISIKKDDISKLESLTQIPPLPNTFPVMFKLINNGNTRVLIESAGGASGTALLGRFGNGHQETAGLLRDIAKFEKDNNSESIIASVVHLPENRIGNVLQNPDLRDFQIPYLSSSSLSPENQIAVNDIWVQFDHDSLILFSKKLNKRIIPRIDNAHNFVSGSLSVYHFLGAMQQEHTIKHLSINQTIAFKGIRLSPRIEYENIILQSAQWFLKREEIISDTADKNIEALMAAFNTKCIEWRIPQLFLWAEGDQTILINRLDLLTFQLFISGIRQKKNVVITEYIQPDPQAVLDQNGQAYNHQFVAIAKTADASKNRRIDWNTLQSGSKIQRSFSPGTAWFYYKIYCSTYFSDALLSTIILPLSKRWKEQEYIDHWFFIRYHDPEHHIRLRFYVLDEKKVPLLINDLQQQLSVYMDQDLIWKTQIDTYERELERYTPQAYPFVEHLFHLDSRYSIQALMHKEEYEKIEFPLFWISLKNIDDIFNLCSFSIEQKHTVASRSARAFQEEFDINDHEKDIILNYYHQHSKQIKLLIENIIELPQAAVFINNWQTNNEAQRAIFDEIKIILSDINKNEQLATSLIHMHYNRLYSTEQRRFEMIGYILITKYYRSVLKQ